MISHIAPASRVMTTYRDQIMAIDLTIGMATYDDPQGVWWTLSSLRMHHDLAGVELLVVDDHPEPNRGEIGNVCNNAQARYVHAPKGLGPAHAKNSVWEHARGSHVLLVDCHVLIAPGAVAKLVAAARADAVGRDMWVGPLRSEAGNIIATELSPELRGDFFGTWLVDSRYPVSETREVHAHGSALSFMRRADWPKFSQHFKGFAGEEIYIHDKVRLYGGKVLYQPWLGWCHRFPRFGAVPYSLTLNDKMRNYLIGAYEMGWNITQFREYFGRKLPQAQRLQVEAQVLEIYPQIFDGRYDHVPAVKTHD